MEFEEIDYWRAATNWVEWKDDYNEAEVANMPVLICSMRFHRFTREYRLQRGFTQDQREPIREWLLCNLNVDAGVSELAEALKNNVGLQNLQISLISKIFCFTDPAQFFPRDRYSTSGLRNMDHGPAHPNYADYNARCHNLFEQNCPTIAAFLVCRPIPTDNLCGFKRRVFDTALMRIGGRWG